MFTTAERKAIRRIRQQNYYSGRLTAFKLVDDDELGRTFIADFVDGDGYVIVELFHKQEDGCCFAITPSGTAYYNAIIRQSVAV